MRLDGVLAKSVFAGHVKRTDADLVVAYDNEVAWCLDRDLRPKLLKYRQAFHLVFCSDTYQDYPGGYLTLAVNKFAKIKITSHQDAR